MYPRSMKCLFVLACLLTLGGRSGAQRRVPEHMPTHHSHGGGHSLKNRILKDKKVVEKDENLLKHDRVMMAKLQEILAYDKEHRQNRVRGDMRSLAKYGEAARFETAQLNLAREKLIADEQAQSQQQTIKHLR